MRHVLAGLLALFALPAFAADKGGPAPAAVVAEPAPAFHGLYIGGMLGHSTGSISDAEGFKFPREGYTATGLVGYNHRLPGVVLGAEADIGVTDVAGTTNVDGFTIKGSSKYIGSLRARVGAPLGHTMLYGTAGVAMTNAKLAVVDIGSGERDQVRGYVYGGGIESYLFGNIGARLEVLRYQWDKESFTIDGHDTGKLRSHDTHVRAGLVFRLN